jgi:RNA polymerase sigma factor (sigma-70 family)
MNDVPTTQIQAWIDQLQSVDVMLRAKAREELLKDAYVRFERMARKSLHGSYCRLHAIEQTNDVVQELCLELRHKWDYYFPQDEQRQVSTAKHFFCRVAFVMRRLLQDLVRKYFGRTNRKQLPISIQAESAIDIADSQLEPPEILVQAESDEQYARKLDALQNGVDALPDELREIVDLRHYQDLSWLEISVLLELPEHTARRRLEKAKYLLAKQLQSLIAE